jgi:hypothetical protein
VLEAFVNAVDHETVEAETPLDKIRDWNHSREMWIRVLEKQTGKGVGHWNARIKKEKFADARSLEAWLAHLGVTGYAKQLLVMERFGYPDFVTASADELIDAQYADRPHLRAIYEAIVAAARTSERLWSRHAKGTSPWSRPAGRLLACKLRRRIAWTLDFALTKKNRAGVCSRRVTRR